MARSWHYPRWKRLALQGAMVAVLGLTLGLAEMVARHQRAAQATQLGDPIAVGMTSVRLPLGWAIEEQRLGYVSAQEPDHDRLGRLMTIQEMQILRKTPLNRLLRDELGNGSTLAPWGPGDGVSGQEPVSIAGNPGLLTAFREAISISPAGDRRSAWIALAPLGPQRAIEVRLDCPDDHDAEGDKRFITDVIQAISPVR